MSWPAEGDFDLPAVAVWERQHREPTKAHAAFRLYRDTPPASRDIASAAEQVGVSARRARQWAVEWQWRERADAWDDECHRVEDKERLDAIRTMHALHRRAARTATVMASRALAGCDPADLPMNLAIRLLELGTKLERQTLVVSVEELQGIDTDEAGEDPWERIARELDPGALADE